MLNHSAYCVLVFILSHTQCCVQLVLFPVVVCVRRVRVIRIKQKKGRSSALPAPLEHPLWPREPSVLHIVSKGQTKSAHPNFYTNSRTAGVDGYSYSSVTNVPHMFQRQRRDQLGILHSFCGLKFCFLFVLSILMLLRSH